MKTLNPTLPATRTDNWLTPPELIQSLGEFDLDPCSPDNRPWDTAKKHFTFVDNGLLLPWDGRVWLNPPYSDIFTWLNKAGLHKNVTALVFARTETTAFQDYVFPFAHSILYIKGRLTFYYPTGEKAKSNSGNASVLISYNEFNSDMMSQSNIPGFHQPLTPDMYLISFDKENRTWRVILDNVMKEFNSEAQLSEIYEKVCQMAPKKVRANKNYKAKIRQVLQQYFKRVRTGIYTN